ncbi:hypothetical protein HQ560_03990 [bacterium]|nr:hypothetical protein [bacterium]
MQTSTTSVLCFVVAAGLGALGQFLYKSGAERATHTVASYLANPHLLAGVACYVAVMVLFVAGFKLGGAMSVLYPVYASTFIWGALIALLAFGEPIRLVNVAGMALLIVGMFLMGLGK